MRPLVLRDRIDAFAIEINRDAAFALQIAPIGLEPTRPAAARQEAVGHDDIGLPAGCGQRTLGDQVAIAGHEHAPCLPASLDGEHAELGAAPALRPRHDGHGLAVGSGQFEQLPSGAA